MCYNGSAGRWEKLLEEERAMEKVKIRGGRGGEQVNKGPLKKGKPSNKKKLKRKKKK